MKSLKDGLTDVMRAYPITKVDLALFLEQWPTLLGPYLAERIRPVRIERGTLVCEVSSAALIQEFSFLQREILAKLRLQNAGQLIRNIKCVTQTADWDKKNQQLNHITEAFAQRKQALTENMTPSPLALWEEEQLRRYTQGIADEKLREKAQRLMLLLMQRQRVLEAKHWPHCNDCQTYYEPMYTRCPYCHLFVFEKETSYGSDEASAE